MSIFVISCAWLHAACSFVEAGGPWHVLLQQLQMLLLDGVASIRSKRATQQAQLAAFSGCGHPAVPTFSHTVRRHTSAGIVSHSMTEQVPALPHPIANSPRTCTHAGFQQLNSSAA